MAKDLLSPLRRFHGFLHDRKLAHKLRQNYLNKFLEKKRKNPHTVFLIFTPEHGNIGDHAIAFSETQFLNQAGIDYVELTGTMLWELEQYHCLDVMNGHPILCQGGGYLGTLWFSAEKALRKVIQCNPDSPIICFPNTIFYESSPFGSEELKKSIDIYNQHKDLHLYARELTSYNLMSQSYQNVKLIPDMVLSLPQISGSDHRNGCVLCLRNDQEKTRTHAQEEMLYQQITPLFGKNISYADMVIDKPISINQRKDALYKQFETFSNADLVITDRLHGMIFCAITGTPCIVINSKSPKVRGCYEWIKDLDYIRFADDGADITAEYEKIPKGIHAYNNSHLQHYYQELMDDILTILNWR